MVKGSTDKTQIQRNDKHIVSVMFDVRKVQVQSKDSVVVFLPCMRQEYIQQYIEICTPCKSDKTTALRDIVIYLNSSSHTHTYTHYSCILTDRLSSGLETLCTSVRLNVYLSFSFRLATLSNFELRNIKKVCFSLLNFILFFKSMMDSVVIGQMFNCLPVL